MLTHLVFGAGSAVAFSPALPANLILSLAVVLSLVVNFLIDGLGHVARGGFVARSPLTHSVFTAPLWGVAAGFVLWRVWVSVLSVGQDLELWFVILGVVVAGSHLLLDSLTERGVFWLANRIALAHLRSGNLLLNGAFLLLGLALIFAYFPGAV